MNCRLGDGGARPDRPISSVLGVTREILEETELPGSE
jgi:hypothetical protein